MAMHALVVVHFNDAHPDKEQVFNKGMDSMDWIAVPDMPNAWAAHFPNADAKGGTEVHEALRQSAVDAVREAAMASGLSHYHAVVHLGSETPTLFDSH